MPDRVVKTTLVIDEHGAVKAVRAVATESDRGERSLGKLDKSVKGLGHSFLGLKNLLIGGAGVASVAYGLKSVLNTTEEALTTTEKFHAISGVGAQQSLLLTSALKARGVSSEAAGRAFAFLTTNIKTAERQENKYSLAQRQAAAKHKLTTAELGKQAAAFRQLFGAQGVGALAGLSGEQKLEKTVKAFERLSPAIKKSGAQAALMKEIFGRGGLALAPVLEGGATGLTHFTEVARKFLPNIKGGQKGVEEWMVKNAEFKLGLEGLELTLGMKLIPVLMEGEKWISKVVLEFKAGKGPLYDIAGAATNVWNAFKGVAEWLGKTVFGLGKTQDILGPLLALMTVGKIGNVFKLGSAFKAIGAAAGLGAPELVLFVGTIIAAIKAVEKITGQKIFKKLGEKLGLLPQEGPHIVNQGKFRKGAPTVAELGRGASLGRPEDIKELEETLLAKRLHIPFAQAEKMLEAKPIVINTKVHLNERVIAEAVAKYSLKKAARQ